MDQKVTAEYLEQVFESAKNWGRWGEDDECGALNYITDKKRSAAAAPILGVTLDLYDKKFT